MENTILFIYSDDYLKHKTGGEHPESPERLKSIVSYLYESDIINYLDIKKPEPASLNRIEKIHTKEYIKTFRYRKTTD